MDEVIVTVEELEELISMQEMRVQDEEMMLECYKKDLAARRLTDDRS